MAQDTYNGWTNYETWNAYLWQKNVESTYKFFLKKRQIAQHPGRLLPGKGRAERD